MNKKEATQLAFLQGNLVAAREVLNEAFFLCMDTPYTDKLNAVSKGLQFLIADIEDAFKEDYESDSDIRVRGG